VQLDWDVASQLMNLIKKPLIILAGITLFKMLLAGAAYGDEDHRVLMIIRHNDGTNGHNYFIPHLISVTTNKVQDIATLRGNVMFGLDDQTIAFKAGRQLLILDRRKLTVIADLVLTNYKNVILKSDPDENLAIDSARGKVYLPVYLHNPDTPEFTRYITNYDASIHDIVALEVDWKTGEQVLFANPGNYARVISLPNAIGVEDGNITLYSKTNHKPLLSFTESTPNAFYMRATANAEFYYVPDLGLFESRSGFDTVRGPDTTLQFQVCDQNLSRNHVNPVQLVITNSPRSTAFDYNGKIFVRNINGKPHWIWVENDGGTNAGKISRIVMANMGSGQETLRAQLNVKTYNPRFIPNADASRVYFFDAETGQIYSFDRNTKTTSRFFKLEDYNNPWAFVDAY
jgi:hypothetical protein